MKLLNYTAVKNKSSRGKIRMKNITPYMREQLLIKLLEQQCGYDKAHKLIERTELEYAMIMNSSNIEVR